MRGVTDQPWSDEMSKRKEMPVHVPGYVLTEEGHAELSRIRDELFLVSEFVMVTTKEEDEVALQIWRNVFGKWLEGFADKIDTVLTAAEWPRRVLSKSSRNH
jgi:hypothetical protein